MIPAKLELAAMQFKFIIMVACAVVDHTADTIVSSSR